MDFEDELNAYVIYDAASDLNNKTENTLEETYKCYFCPMKFYSQEDAEEHQTIHAEFKCDNCNKVYFDAESLKSHSRVHNKTYESSKCLCMICDEQFKSNKQLREHVQNIHFAGDSISTDDTEIQLPTVYKCLTCKKVFYDVKSLRQHEVIHYKSTYKCLKCLNCFNNNADLTEHQNFCLESETGEIIIYECNRCKKRFEKYQTLLKHACAGSFVKNRQVAVADYSSRI